MRRSTDSRGSTDMRRWVEDGATAEERDLLEALRPGVEPPAGAQASVLAALGGRLGVEFGTPDALQSDLGHPDHPDFPGHGGLGAPHTAPSAPALATASKAAAAGAAGTSASAGSAIWKIAVWKWLGLGVVLGSATSGALRAGDAWLNAPPQESQGRVQPSAGEEAAQAAPNGVTARNQHKGADHEPDRTSTAALDSARPAPSAAAGDAIAHPPAPQVDADAEAAVAAPVPSSAIQVAPGGSSVAGFAAPVGSAPGSTRASLLKEEREQLALARAALQAGQAGRALSVLSELRRRRPALMLSQEHEALSISALAHAGSRAQAQARARAFIARYPNSPLVDSVAPYAR